MIEENYAYINEYVELLGIFVKRIEYYKLQISARVRIVYCFLVHVRFTTC